MLAIAGGKGGAGKTTTTLGLAAALDGPVLVVDADVDMPNLHAMAGVDREPTLADGVELAQRVPDAPDVGVLPAPLGRGSGDDPRVGDLLSDLSHAGRHVLVDCPAGASPDAVAPMRAADSVLLVSSLCGPALRDTAKTAAMARAVGSPPVGAALTRTQVAPEAVEDLLGCGTLTSVPTATSDPLSHPRVREAYARLARALASGQEIL